ncbi:MAG: tripartite tricarboxylate transporter substrate binding protein [Xanthobacteraceae bacterium]
MSHVLRLIPTVIVSLLIVIVQAAAQTYPDRVVRIINPYPPGGSVDITARILAQKLSDNTGHQFIVENRTGAGGNTGADSVAKSAPDGYTLMFTAPPPLAINQTLYTKGLPYDPAKDFVAIGTFALTPIVLMVHPGIPAKNVQELIAYAKANPGKVHFGSAGIGTTPHLSGELFKSMAKVEIVHVPYRGTGPAMNDLVGGHIQMFFDLLPASLQQINAGNVRALANAGAKRPPALPDLPTVAEQGLAGFDSASWVALAAPAKTPAPVVAKLREEVGKVLTSPDIVARIRELGSEPGTVNEKDVRAFLDAETKKWAEVIRVSGAKAD